MSDLIALAFDDQATADEVLRRLRSLRSAHLLDLEDACIVERDEAGHFHLKQAISERLNGLPHHFWHHVVGHILHHGRPHMPESGPTPELGLDRRFVREVTRALDPGTSALLAEVKRVSLDDLLTALKDHHGKILTTSLPEREREALAAALAPPPPRFPPASDLLRLVQREQEEKSEHRRREREAAAEERRRRIERLRSERLTDRELGDLIRHAREAARRGETRILVLRFPSDLCTDRGRAINNELPEWPDTLVGQPKDLYEYWRDRLRPAGYRLHAEVLDYPEGIPGDVGFILSWADD